MRLEVSYLSFLLFLCGFSVYPQGKGAMLIEEMDSILDIRFVDTSKVNYRSYHKVLKSSLSNDYKKGEMLSYARLMKYFSLKKNLDSMMYYAHRFEMRGYEEMSKNIVHNFFFDKGAGMMTDFGMVEQSLEEFHKAYKYLDPEELASNMNLKSALAYTYMTKRQFDRAIETLLPFVQDSINIPPVSRLRALSVLAAAYQCKDNVEKSYPLNLKALEIAGESGDSSSYYFIKNSINYDYFLQGKFNKVIDSSLSIMEDMEKFDSEVLRINNYNLSRAYDTLGYIDDAIHFMEKAINTKDDYHRAMTDYNQLEALVYLADLYEQKGDYRSATLQLQKRSAIVDSMRVKEQRAFTDYYDIKTKIIDEQREKEKIEAEKKILSLRNNKQKQYIAILSFGITCLLLIFILIWIYSKYFRSKEKIKELENNEREILKNHIEVREAELTALAASKAKLLRELSEIKKKLTSAIQQDNQPRIFEAEKELNSFLTQTANDDVFSERLESQYPGMVMTLRNLHPELSQNDIRHCILVKLSLSLKESAQLMHVGTGAIKMGRNRAKAKMNLPEDLSLKQYLDQISKETAPS